MRFRQRHLQQTIVDHLQTRLTALGWITDPVNYGTSPVTITEDVDVETAPAELAPNTLAVTIPDEGPDQAAELGGGLYQATYSLFIDCYGSSVVMATRILQDVKAELTDLVLPVVDYSGQTPVQTDERCEFEVVAIEPPRGRDIEARRRWRVMTVDLTAYFAGSGP